MIESGIVNRIKDNRAWVTVVKGEQCQGCNACKSFGEGSAEVIADNRVGAKQGDRVEVEVAPEKVIGHSIVVFIFPIIALIIGYFVGSKYLINWGVSSEGGGIIGSLGLMVISFFAIYIYDRFFLKSDDASAKIVRVIKGTYVQK